jgi:hypothetical protein
MPDLSFSRNEHLIALELKFVKVKNLELGAKHALHFIDGPLDGDVNFKFFFCVNYF